MRADLAFEDAPGLRCHRCSKVLQVDLGQDVFGNSSAGYFCPSCGVIPQVSEWDARLIREVVAQVTHNSARRDP